MPLSAAERMKNSRWVNKLEEMADLMLVHMGAAPEPLPREPVIDPRLLDQLAQFTILQDNIEDDVQPVRFLELGNGHQVANRKKAIVAATKLVPTIKRIDDNTVEVDGVGTCHFAAYTHLKGAMISSTRIDENSFGSAHWHSKERIAMFRDTGDGRCIIYIARIEPLLALRTIGQHGVKWEDVHKSAFKIYTIKSTDALDAI